MTTERMHSFDAADIEAVNAFADGELGAADAAALSERIAKDAALAAALARVKAVKRGVASLSVSDLLPPSNTAPAEFLPPKPSARHTARTGWRPLSKLGTTRGLAAAAVAALAVLVAAPWMVSAPAPVDAPQAAASPEGVVGWHQALSARSYDMDSRAGVADVTRDLPGEYQVADLQASKLYLVDAEVIQETAETSEFVVHYSGLSDCRLSIWVGRNTTPSIVDGAPNLRHWQVGETSYAVVATLMDTGRFASIADFVETFTRERGRWVENDLIAMQEAYEASTRCG